MNNICDLATTIANCVCIMLHNIDRCLELVNDIRISLPAIQSGGCTHNINEYILMYRRYCRSILFFVEWCMICESSILIWAIFCFFIHSYWGQRLVVEVTSGAAVRVNFTLRTNIEQWSALHDFDISENLSGDLYMNIRQMRNAFLQLHNHYPSLSSISSINTTEPVCTIGMHMNIYIYR